eukprot:Selendium_serpulae@DN6216_c2_g1_i14.p1
MGRRNTRRESWWYSRYENGALRSVRKPELLWRELTWFNLSVVLVIKSPPWAEKAYKAKDECEEPYNPIFLLTDYHKSIIYDTLKMILKKSIFFGTDHNNTSSSL